MKKRLWLILAVSLTLVGLFFRFFHLGTLPSEMHRDEVAIGYNAFSLLKTGRDEHGAGPWPMNFVSFGDYKLPGMIYSVALSQQYWGVNTFATRFPTAFLGTLLIPIAGLLMWELFGGQKRLVILAMGLLSINTWHIFLSRTAYEPIMGLTLSTLGLYLFLRGRRQPLFMLISVPVFLLSFATYNVPLLLMPMVLPALVLIYRKDFFQRKWLSLTAVLLIGSMVFAGMTFASSSQGKLKATLLGDAGLRQDSEEFFAALIADRTPYPVARILSFPMITVGYTLAKNYFTAFDPNYLFFKGGLNPWHSLGVVDVGNLNLVMVPLLLIAVRYLTIRGVFKNDQAWQFLVIYLVLSPLPDALTLDAPVTNRLMDFHLALTLLAAAGGDALFALIRNALQQKIAVIGLVLLAVGSLNWFWWRYTSLHQRRLDPLWYEGIAQVASFAAFQRDTVDRVYIDMNHTPGHPLIYIYFAFYAQYDPTTFQTQAEWSTDTEYQVAKKFEPYVLMDLPPISEISPTNIELFYPDGVENVMFVTRLVDTKPTENADLVVSNATGQAIWEVVIKSREELAPVAPLDTQPTSQARPMPSVTPTPITTPGPTSPGNNNQTPPGWLKKAF